MKLESKKFFGKEINMEVGMGSPYRPDNLFPILFILLINKLSNNNKWRLK